MVRIDSKRKTFDYPYVISGRLFVHVFHDLADELNGFGLFSDRGVVRLNLQEITASFVEDPVSAANIALEEEQAGWAEQPVGVSTSWRSLFCRRKRRHRI